MSIPTALTGLFIVASTVLWIFGAVTVDLTRRHDTALRWTALFLTLLGLVAALHLFGWLP